jgi:hypothetical protein
MLAALLAAIGIYLLTDAIGQAFIERVYMSAEAQNQRNLATVSSFQTYAREFNLSSRDTEMISRWAISQDDTYILLYKDRRLALEAGWWGIDEESSGTESLDDLYDVITYPVYLRDGVFQAVVYDFSEAKLYGGVQIGAIALACVMFAIFMLIYNRRITRAIVEISEEVKQIGDGNLQLQLTASGDDELARLTESVESMRKSILKKTDEQQQALEKNQSLISAMSHDIRNPLTALLGYLDLALSGQYRSPEEMKSYLEAAYSRALQLKTLTDELFRYSLVFGAQELPIQLEPFDAAALLDQIVGEGIVMLEQKGYTIRRAVQPVSCQIQVDASYFKRVLDNLADNICKYADPAKPIHVLVAQESGALTLCVSNTILKNPGQVESNRIGLRICEKIMRQMGGTFEKRQTEDTFTVTLTLPVQPLAVEEGETS